MFTIMAHCELQEFLGHQVSSSCNRILHISARRRAKRDISQGLGENFKAGGESKEANYIKKDESHIGFDVNLNKGGGSAGANYNYKSDDGFTVGAAINAPIYPNMFSSITTSAQVGYTSDNVGLYAQGFRTWGGNDNWGVQFGVGFNF